MAAKIFAVGDIAGPPNDNPGAAATGLLIGQLMDAEPQAKVLVIGDTVYADGTLKEFQDYYEPTWGGVRDQTYPCPGNHEFHTYGQGYFQYFGKRAGSPAQSWYSFDVEGWHVVSLNTELHNLAGSPQLNWLRDDLTNRKQERILAFFHRQRWGSGGHGDDVAPTTAFWEALSEHRAELVLCGHAHHYECFAPQRPDQTPDSKGIRQFILGTGGRHHVAKTKDTPNSEKAEFKTYGVLQLTLEHASYSWNFIPVAGSSFTHSGTYPTNH